MNAISTVFFGTHQFAATILEVLLHDPQVSVELVITQPDRPVGREQHLQKSPVKIIAEKYHTPIDQPPTLKSYKLKAISYKLGIVAQYGLLIPKTILDAFPKGILNVHTSLLPKYRGASPIQTALMNGEKKTGVTIMKLDEGLDTGPIITQKETSIDPDETAVELEKRLAILAIDALSETIPGYISGNIVPQPQNNTQASLTRELTRDDGRIDWKQSARDIYNQWRAMTPWPGIWTTWSGKRIKLLKILPQDAKILPGIVQKNGDTMVIGCKEGVIEVDELQLEGGKKMSASVFLPGHPDIVGARLE